MKVIKKFNDFTSSRTNESVKTTSNSINEEYDVDLFREEIKDCIGLEPEEWLQCALKKKQEVMSISEKKNSRVTRHKVNENYGNVNEGLISWVKDFISGKSKEEKDDEKFIKELTKRLKSRKDASDLGINIAKFGVSVLGNKFNVPKVIQIMVKDKLEELKNKK